MAQFHRWLQFYELPWSDELVERQLVELFAADFEIVFADGSTVVSCGRDRSGFAGIAPSCSWSHVVEWAEVEERDSRRVRLLASVRSLAEAGGRHGRAAINIEAELVGELDSEPLFTRLELTPGERHRRIGVEDAYPRNRALSFVHRWLSCVENPALGAARFNELLGEDGGFELALGTSVVRDRASMAEWLEASARRVETSVHAIEDFVVLDVAADIYTIGMDFDWTGSAADGTPMRERIRHRWTLQDTGERYCRILSAETSPIRPLARVGR